MLAEKTGEVIAKFWTADLWFARLAVGLGTLLWGVLLLSDAGTGAMRRPVFATMTGIAPAWVWGTAFFICACLQLGSALSGIKDVHGWYSVIIAGMVAWLWWAVLATMVVATGVFSPGVMTGNVAIAFLATVIFVRVFVRRN